MFGRIGDTPCIGAGNWADNETAAVSCTGYGEQIMRTVLAKTTANFVKTHRASAQKAADLAMEYLKAKVKGLAGLIIIDKNGSLGYATTTGFILVAYFKKPGRIKIIDWLRD